MKVPRLRQDADVARVAVARHGAARRSLVPQRVEHRGAVDDTARHQMDDTLLAALHFALDQHQPRRHDGAALALEMPRPAQNVDDPALVLDRDADRIALAGPLTDQNKPGGADESAIIRRRAL